jgi:hypothetical protein
MSGRLLMALAQRRSSCPTSRHHAACRPPVPERAAHSEESMWQAKGHSAGASGRGPWDPSFFRAPFFFSFLLLLRSIFFFVSFLFLLSFIFSLIYLYFYISYFVTLIIIS